MNGTLILIFIGLNIANVIIQTIKSIATLKCGPGVAAIVNAIAFALYTVVTVYMLCDLSLWLKALIVGLCNLVGVYIVKWCEVKAQKDKLWKIECTAWLGDTEKIHKELGRIPHTYIQDVGPWTIFNIYCYTKAQSRVVKEILNKYNTHYFVNESKTL